MAWVLRIEHHTSYLYKEPAEHSYNEARMTPLTSDGQSVIDSSLAVEPEASVLSYVDYWGSVVHAFDLHEPHRSLDVRAVSIVVTENPPASAELPAGTVEDLRSEQLRDRFAELVGPTAYAPTGGAIADAAREIAASSEPYGVFGAVHSWLAGRLVYERGVTAVSSSALEALAAGRGVCQDYAHAGVAILRSMGVPARYVSGYFLPEGGIELGVPVIAETHAWVEAYLGRWEACDLTNDVPVGERHVAVAKGRDYADVAPLKGVYSGGAVERLGVSVTLTRVA